MKHTCGNFWGLLLILAAVLVLIGNPAPARQVVDRSPSQGSTLDEADPNATRDLIAHDIGNVRMTLSNWGEVGNPDGAVGFKGFEFPINSGSDFLFSGGVWVGAQVSGLRLVSTTTDGDNGTNEFYPVHIGSIPAVRLSRDQDWFVSSKSFSEFNGESYVFGAKDLDDDGDWNAETVGDDKDGNRQPSRNYDLGGGKIGYDDDGDGLIDEDAVTHEGNVYTEVDGDADGNFDDTDVSGDANNDGNAAYDPEPHIDEDPAGDMSSDYIDNDFDGLVDLADPDADGDLNIGFLDDDNDGLEDEDGVARGVQEYYTVFQDNITGSYVGSPDGDGHTPLNIQVLQRSYAFPEDYAAEFILIDYRIRNVGPLPLDNVFIGMFSDPDIGAAGESGDAASLDDRTYYDPERLMMVMYDSPTDGDGTGPGIFGIRVVQTPVALDQLRVSYQNFERVAGGDPEFNSDKYNMISSGQVSEPSAQDGDWRMLFGFGAEATNGFRLMPGDELPITVAFIAGEDTTQGAINAEWALAMYLNDFQGPSSPDVPAFEVDVYADHARIRWAPNAEASVDAITGFSDFEGYIIERSTDQINWQTIAAYDLVNTLEYPFEWQNFNLGMPTDTLWNSDRTAFEYYFIDNGLITGHTYYYAVRAFDQGVQGAGVLYSGRTGNVAQALIARGAESAAELEDLSGIYVYPNPYKGSHAGESGGQVNPSKGLIEYPRKIYFMGLPPTTSNKDCLIRIYTLSGDHLATIDHVNGREYDQWDMVTKDKQEIVSGIYYYVVEYKSPTGGTKQFIDKFVVIK